MTAAEKILIVGGMLNLAYGVITGVPMSLIRLKGASAVPKYLTFAHIGPLMQGPLLLGTAMAVRLSAMSATVETTGAWLLVVGSLLLALKDTLNWLLGVVDEFRKRVATKPLGALAALATGAGTAIFVLGVMRAI